MINTSELMWYVPFVGITEKQLSRLEADLWRAIMNWRVYDAKVWLAWDLFGSMSHTKDDMVWLNQHLIRL